MIYDALSPPSFYLFPFLEHIVNTDVITTCKYNSDVGIKTSKLRKT